jgi:hypothetical protein
MLEFGFKKIRPEFIRRLFAFIFILSAAFGVSAQELPHSSPSSVDASLSTEFLVGPEADLDRALREYDGSSYEQERRETLKDFGKKNRGSLSDVEMTALHWYTKYGYDYVNKALWSGDSFKIKHVQPVVAILNGALDKIPPFRGRVTRQTNLSDLQRALHQKGATVSYPAFISTSARGGHYVPVDGSNSEDILEIESRTGRDISRWSTNPEEKEVLFRPGTRFTVQKVRTEKEDEDFVLHTYRMKEVE